MLRLVREDQAVVSDELNTSDPVSSDGSSTENNGNRPQRRRRRAQPSDLQPPDIHLRVVNDQEPDSDQPPAEEQTAPAQNAAPTEDTSTPADPTDAAPVDDQTPATPSDDSATAAPVQTATEPAELQDGPVDLESDDDDDEPDAEDQPLNLPIIEALLFSTHCPLTAARLGELLEIKGTKPIRKAIAALNEQYEQAGRTFRIEQVAGGYQMLTLAEYGEYLKKLHQREIDAKLTKAALETLAIIAYKQPILRADIEAIRGVACGETIRSLMEKHLVKIAGRAEEPGRPILYGTTKRFLEVFGLNGLKDLPQPETPGTPKP